MAWLTVDDMDKLGLIPCEIYDANGLLIRRSISGFDAETGEVESQVMDVEGKYIFTTTHEDERVLRRVLRRIEKFAPPLLAKKYTGTGDHPAYLDRNWYWDVQDKLKEQQK